MNERNCLFSVRGRCAREVGLLGLAGDLLRHVNSGRKGITIGRMMEILRGERGKSDLREYARDLDDFTNSSCANCFLRK